MKLAFVIPFYGVNIPGGAEEVTRRTAENLAQRGWQVEALTTCIRDFHGNWSKNHHRPGIYQINGVSVRRFPVKRRRKRAFDTVNQKLLDGLPISAREEQVFVTEMIKTPELYRFIKSHHEDYFYFFTPYPFSTTYVGSRIHPQRSCIIACLHDEAYARLDSSREMFEQARAVVFYTPAERRLATSLYRLDQTDTELIGAGVDTDIHGSASAFRDKYGINDPFLLYVGRRSPDKNVPLLVDYYAKYKQNRESPLKLVLIGKGEVDIPPEHESHIIDLGFVSLQDKLDAYAAATVLCQPSVHESFSLVIMEAWLCGTPCLVHAGCEVTREHCLRSNGGLFFGNYLEFEAAVDFLLGNPELAKQMGANGSEYVLSNYAWEIVMEKYESALTRWGVTR